MLSILMLAVACGQPNDTGIPDCWDYATYAVFLSDYGASHCDDTKPLDIGPVLDNYCEPGSADEEGCRACYEYMYRLGVHSCTQQ